MAGGGDSTLVGIAAVIAALASFVSAVASIWTNRKLGKGRLVEDDDDEE